MRKRYICFIMIAFFMALITACHNLIVESGTDLLQHGGAGNQNCDLDCWRIIQPGKTTENQFNLIVENADPESFKQLEVGELNQDEVGYSWYDGVIGFRLAAYFSEGVVEKIEIFPNMTIEESFDFFGEPDSYSAFFAPGEREHLWVDFYYNEGVLITILDENFDISMLTDTEDCNINILGTDPVLIIQIFDPEKPSKFLAGFNPDRQKFPWGNFNSMHLTQDCDY